MVIFILSGQLISEESDPELAVFSGLVKKVLKSQKSSVDARAGVWLLKEAIKIGGCLFLVNHATKQFSVDLTSWSDVSEKLVAFYKFAKFGDESYFRNKQYYGVALLLIAITLHFLCDSCIYKRDPTLFALNNLAEYVQCAPTELKSKIAELVKNNKYDSQIEHKILHENDGVDINALRLFACFFDIMLPMLPPLLFAANNGWDPDRIKKQLKRQLNFGVFEKDPLNNVKILLFCTSLAAVNILPSLMTLSDSTDSQKWNTWRFVVKKLNLKNT